MFSAIQGKAKDSHICLLDSSCTKHMTLHKEWFHNLEPLPSLEDIYLGHGKSQQTKGMGSISFFLELRHKLDVHNVFYVHGLTQSLISLGQIVTFGMKLRFEDDVCWISTKDMKRKCENTIKKKRELVPSWSLNNGRNKYLLPQVNGHACGTLGSTHSFNWWFRGTPMH
jgi:hypothetical protein